MIEQNRDIIVGIKTAHWQQPNYISVQKAVEAGTRNHVPVMVDFGWFDNKSYEKMISTITSPRRHQHPRLPHARAATRA